MYDDVSEINPEYCNVLTSSDTLVSYSGNRRIDYANNGGRWVKWRSQISNYGNYDISGFTCIDISSLKSNAVFEPIYYMCAFGLFVFLIVLCKYVLGGLIRVFR